MGEAGHQVEVEGHQVKVGGHRVEVEGHQVEAGIVHTAVAREGGTQTTIEVTPQVEVMCTSVIETPQHRIMIVADMSIEVMVISEISLVTEAMIMFIEVEIAETGLMTPKGLAIGLGLVKETMVVTGTDRCIDVGTMIEIGIMITIEIDMMTEIRDVEDIIKETEIAEGTQIQRKNQKKKSRMRKNQEHSKISVSVCVCVEMMMTMMMTMTMMIARKTSLPEGDICIKTRGIQ